MSVALFFSLNVGAATFVSQFSLSGRALPTLRCGQTRQSTNTEAGSNAAPSVYMPTHS